MSKIIDMPKVQVMPTFALHKWSYTDYNDYIRHSLSGELEQAGHLLEQIIDDWSMFNVPENHPHPFDKLKLMSEAVPLVHTVRESIKSYQEDIDTTVVRVDMDAWEWGDFNKFKALSAKGSKKAITMMREVCILVDDYEAEQAIEDDKKRERAVAKRLSAELTAVEGILMMTAMTEVIQKVFAGKN